MQKFYIPLFVILVIVIQGCKKNCEDYARNYSFENRVVLEARRLDTLNVGDTIKLTIKIPFNQKNNLDSQLVSLQNAKLFDYGLWIISLNFINNNLIINGLDRFKIFNLIGDYYIYNTSTIKYKLKNENNFYTFSVAIIPNGSGLIRITPFKIDGELPKSCSVFNIYNSFKNYNSNHQYFYDLTGGNVSSSSLTERDFFIWVK